MAVKKKDVQQIGLQDSNQLSSDTYAGQWMSC